MSSSQSFQEPLPVSGGAATRRETADEHEPGQQAIEGHQIADFIYHFLRDYKLERGEPYFEFFLEQARSNQRDGGAGEGEAAAQSVSPYDSQIKRWDDENDNKDMCLLIDMKHILNYESSAVVGNSAISTVILSRYISFKPDIRSGIRRRAHDLIASRNPTCEFCFFNLQTIERVRTLRSWHIGKLTAVTATVTRMSEVRPQLIMAMFRCGLCGSETEKHQTYRFEEPKTCTNKNCQNRAKWKLITEKSKFIDWQKLRIQENPTEIPAGAMPRTFDAIVNHNMCDRVKPGDKVIINGTLIPQPDALALMKLGDHHQAVRELPPSERKNLKLGNLDGVTGLKQLGVRELNYKFIFKGESIHLKSDYTSEPSYFMQNENDEANFTSAERDQVYRIKEQSHDIFAELSEHIAPAVAGLKHVKQGILLQMLGGVQKRTKDKMKLRGDINVCIVGDPSTAKSQFLKYVCGVIPRSIYTSGKTSSAAGLTASVQRDADTGEFCIEAGAMMLADNGICCIDEFDMMDPKDQVAIHEAMEQQTISIAKAGIQATLNARTSILAAVNPLFGRYDPKKKLRQNIGLSQPIMSRFDLFFVLLDKCDPALDEEVSDHVLRLHRHEEDAMSGPLTDSQVNLFIRFARKMAPKFSEESMEYLIEQYTELRAEDKSGSRQAHRITVRQMESLIRLSEACAKAELALSVGMKHVKMAVQLLRSSIVDVEMNDQLEFDILGGGGDAGELLAYAEGEERGDGGSAGLGGEDSSIRLTYNQYKQYLKEIIEIVDTFIIEHETDPPQAKVIEEYLQKKVDFLKSEEEATRQARVLDHVIDYMIVKENVLVVTEPDEDPAFRKLTININYRGNH